MADQDVLEEIFAYLEERKDWDKKYLGLYFIKSGRRKFDLSNADFRNQSLREEWFHNNGGKTHLDMQGINFEGADLRESKFNDVELARANFKSANLRSAYFLGHPHPLSASGACFDHADLHSAIFQNMDLSHTSFDGADMQDVNFSHVNLSGADLSKAKNIGRWSYHSDIIIMSKDTKLPKLLPSENRSYFNDDDDIYTLHEAACQSPTGFAIWQDGEAVACEEDGAYFTRMPIPKAPMPPPSSRLIGEADPFRQRVIAEIERLSSAGEELHTCPEFDEFKRTERTEAIDLRQVEFSKRKWKRGQFVRFDFAGANFDGTEFEYVEFKTSNLAQANFANTRQNGVQFRNCTLQQAVFDRAHTKFGTFQCNDLGGASFKQASLYCQQFFNSNLTKADFTGAKLQKCRFYNTELSGADFTDATLFGAEIGDDVIVSSETKLPPVRVPKRQLSDSDINDLQAENLLRELHDVASREGGTGYAITKNGKAVPYSPQPEVTVAAGGSSAERLPAGKRFIGG